MSDKAKEILKAYRETYRPSEKHEKFGEVEKIREQLINKFNNLPLEDQYQVLLEAAQTMQYDNIAHENSNTDVYPFFFEHNKNNRIIDILNYKFPNGIEGKDGAMPNELYHNLLTFFPNSNESYESLLTQTNIFKNQYGTIDSKKIIEYWTDPNIRIEYKEKHFGEIFKGLDPDMDRYRNNSNYGISNNE